MTTAAPRHEPTAQELDERTQDAWAAYSESLRDVTGSDYDAEEERSWGRLQRELQEIAERRAELRTPDPLR